MPKLLCNACDKLTDILPKNWKYYSGVNFDQVCSIRCLALWIKAGRKRAKNMRYFDYPKLELELAHGHVYSNLTRMFFRSGYEKDVADFLTYRQMQFLYEPAEFKINGASYIPDFYLPDYDSFIEVKGMWNPSSKSKYLKLKDKYPKVRILLLGARHQQEIKKWHLRVD